MRNLLSQKDKKILQSEYRLRVAIVLSAFLFFTILAGGALLIPSYFISESNERATKEHTDIVKESVAERKKNVSSAVLLETKEKLKLLAFDESSVSLGVIFKKIIDNRPNEININGIFYDKNKAEKETKILIIGEAGRRESLLEFKKLLEIETLFTGVMLPVSDLAPDSNIKFSIKVTGNF